MSCSTEDKHFEEEMRARDKQFEEEMRAHENTLPCARQEIIEFIRQKCKDESKDAHTEHKEAELQFDELMREVETRDECFHLPRWSSLMHKH